MLGYAAAYMIMSIIQAERFMLWQFNQLIPSLGNTVSIPPTEDGAHTRTTSSLLLLLLLKLRG